MLGIPARAPTRSDPPVDHRSRNWANHVAPPERRIEQKEATIARAGKTTIAKRDREKAKQAKQREKEARRVQRKAEKPDRPTTSTGEDPDLEGLRWGPQEPLY
ncbi:hypothetical protein NSPZN2_50271 [Nitrospira defluvii]|uniref:Uncharacterized protein n=1 Tax=Nitrospira defluvii TaxID=330214 RepID=A0ABM8S527_9BACT|nr:hypothetical protein NSPZN2_50271 [Nitrospira defluvii]